MMRRGVPAYRRRFPLVLRVDGMLKKCEERPQDAKNKSTTPSFASVLSLDAIRYSRFGQKCTTMQPQSTFLPQGGRHSNMTHTRNTNLKRQAQLHIFAHCTGGETSVGLFFGEWGWGVPTMTPPTVIEHDLASGAERYFNCFRPPRRCVSHGTPPAATYHSSHHCVYCLSKPDLLQVQWASILVQAE